MKNQTKAEFARKCGVSRAAITQAVNKGKIQLTTDGNIDPANHVNQFYSQRNVWKAPLKQSRKKQNEVLKVEPEAEKVFTEMLEGLNKEKPQSLVDKIKNEISFEVVGLFSAFNFWTGGQLDQSFLVEKCEVWVKSVCEGIDKINED